MNVTANFLSNDQVHKLNEKHGWFQYGDAQSGVSRAFAQDAIAMHERIRTAAPLMLAALKQAHVLANEACYGQDKANTCWEILKQIEEALAAAGEQV